MCGARGKPTPSLFRSLSLSLSLFHPYAHSPVGIDDRNQFDLTRSLPGGVDGLRVVVDQLHAAGVKVLWAYNPWDKTTYRPLNFSDAVAMAELLRDTGADGFNGDCMGSIPAEFFDAALKIYKPIAMEGEGGLGSLTSLNWQTLGWCEGCAADEPGCVGRWLELFGGRAAAEGCCSKPRPASKA